MGRKVHIMVYLADKFGRFGLGQSPRFAVSEKLRRKRTQHPHSRKTELTRIRKTPASHMWTQALLSRNQGEGGEGRVQRGPAGLA